MEKDQIFILKDRGIIYISGEDAEEFLQNIVTNDIIFAGLRKISGVPVFVVFGRPLEVNCRWCRRFVHFTGTLNAT